MKELLNRIGNGLIVTFCACFLTVFVFWFVAWALDLNKFDVIYWFTIQALCWFAFGFMLYTAPVISKFEVTLFLTAKRKQEYLLSEVTSLNCNYLEGVDMEGMSVKYFSKTDFSFEQLQVQ